MVQFGASVSTFSDLKFRAGARIVRPPESCGAWAARRGGSGAVLQQRSRQAGNGQRRGGRAPAQVSVRPSDQGTQKFADGMRRKFTPFDAEFVFVPARHVGLDDRGVVLRPQRQIDGDLDAGQDARLEIRFYQRAADTEIREPALPHRESMSDYPDRKIDLNALAPSMLHEMIMS